MPRLGWRVPVCESCGVFLFVDGSVILARIMSKPISIQWLSEPEEHDFPAAQSYLTLLYPESVAAQYSQKLRDAPSAQFKAKDIFRASGLPLLGMSNSHVEANCDKIKAGQSLSPLLLVRDPQHGKVIIADGYHRLCAVYSFAEDSVIPCKIV